MVRAEKRAWERMTDSLTQRGHTNGVEDAVAAVSLTHLSCSQQEQDSHCIMRPDSVGDWQIHLTESEDGPGLNSTSPESRKIRRNSAAACRGAVALVVEV